MSNSSLAHRLLCLVTVPDRADAIVGDLAEESRSRGKVWFWTQASYAFLAYCFRTASSRPRYFALIAMSGLFVYTVIYVGLFEFAEISGFRRYVGFDGRGFGLVSLPWGFWARLALVVLCSNLLTGLVLGRFASVPGTNGVLPLLALWVIYWVIWPAIGFFAFSFPWTWVLGIFWVLPLFALLPLMAGGAITGHLARHGEPV